jgi:glucosamine--fructose-6-phosphate aminotransferase (isomerizing)
MFGQGELSMVGYMWRFNMSELGIHTQAEILSQPSVWAKTLDEFGQKSPSLIRAWRNDSPRQVLFIGCGSSYYLAQTVSRLFRSLTGIPSQACPASELFLFPAQVLADPRQTLLIAISRSGTTTEVLVAVEQFRRLGGPAAWAITCYPESTLAQIADEALTATAAQEKSLAQTRSFTSMLLLAQALATSLGQQETAVLARLPEVGQELLAGMAALAAGIGQRPDLNQFFFLGSGALYGLAGEAMLKIKEMSLSHSESYHFLEFRHGPKALVNSQSLVVGLLSAEAYAHEHQVLLEMGQLGAETLALAPQTNASGMTYSVALGSELPDWALPVLYLLPLQLLAYHRAVGKGLDPDNPRHLQAVVHLDIRNES